MILSVASDNNVYIQFSLESLNLFVEQLAKCFSINDTDERIQFMAVSICCASSKTHHLLCFSRPRYVYVKHKSV